MTVATEVVPGNAHRPPVNTRVLVYIMKARIPVYGEPHERPRNLRRRDESVAREQVEFLVRRPGRRAIAARTVTYTQGETRVIEMTPTKYLRAWTQYEVVVVFADGRSRVLDSFRTAGHVDEEPPAWGGILRARYSQARWLSGSCDDGMPRISLEAGLPPDESHDYRTMRLGYAIWMTKDGGPIDYDRPPLTLTRDGGGLFSLGHRGACNPENLELPEQATRARIGIRMFDLAGNMGTPSEVVFDLPGSEPPAMATDAQSVVVADVEGRVVTPTDDASSAE